MTGVRSEDVPGMKWDKCVSDTAMKMGGGLALGIVLSVIVLKRKAWPVIFGLGAGTGMGFANCQHLFDEPYLVKADKIVVTQKLPSVVVEEIQ